MLGPIDWASYGVLMAPLFLLLAYQFWRESAPPPLWIGLGLAFLLAELVWDPLESLAQTPVPVVVFSYTAGQFSQYVLLFVWARWRQLRRASVWSSALRPWPAGTRISAKLPCSFRAGRPTEPSLAPGRTRAASAVRPCAW